jgi:hypothetical protein
MYHLSLRIPGKYLESRRLWIWHRVFTAKQIYAYEWSSVNLSYRERVLTDGGGAPRSGGQDIGIRLRGEKFQAQLKLNNLLVKANSLQRNMQEMMRTKILWMEYNVTLHA